MDVEVVDDAIRPTCTQIGCADSGGGPGSFLRLLLPSLSLGPALLHQRRGLRDPLAQLPKNGPEGLRDVLLQGLAQERPGTRRLFYLRCLRLRGVRCLRLRGALWGL